MTSNLDEKLTGRLQQALSASAEEIFQLILDPHPDVLQTVLKNRRTTENYYMTRTTVKNYISRKDDRNMTKTTNQNHITRKDDRKLYD